jgi:hypothetical protein
MSIACSYFALRQSISYQQEEGRRQSTGFEGDEIERLGGKSLAVLQGDAMQIILPLIASQSTRIKLFFTISDYANNIIGFIARSLWRTIDTVFTYCIGKGTFFFTGMDVDPSHNQ